MLTDYVAMDLETTGLNPRMDKIIEIGAVRVRNGVVEDTFCTYVNPDVAILCLPREEVQRESERLVNCGVRGFWNFSHYDLFMDHKDKNIVVNNVHLGDSLMTLCYQVNELDRT